MSTRTRLTDEQKAAVVRGARNSVTYENLAMEFGCSPQTIFRIIKAAKSQSICPKCGVAVLPGAHFCHMCGAELLIPAEKAIRLIDDVKAYFVYVPSDRRDAFMKKCCDAVKLIREGAS